MRNNKNNKPWITNIEQYLWQQIRSKTSYFEDAFLRKWEIAYGEICYGMNAGLTTIHAYYLD